eukprot:SAG25_NODE_3550_length_1045_cov_0.891121_2_plen_51_part_01
MIVAFCATVHEPRLRHCMHHTSTRHAHIVPEVLRVRHANRSRQIQHGPFPL